MNGAATARLNIEPMRPGILPDGIIAHRDIDGSLYLFDGRRHEPVVRGPKGIQRALERLTGQRA